MKIKAVKSSSINYDTVGYGSDDADCDDNNNSSSVTNDIKIFNAVMQIFAGYFYTQRELNKQSM